MQDRAFDPDRNPVDELADEFAQRLRDGQCPSISTYVEQYPQYAQEIRDVFPPIAMLERISRREQFDCEAAAWGREAGTSVIKQLGDYRIIREIGRGGMGVVYEAVQESLGRTVAVKVLTANAVSLPRQLKRFRREAQAAAKLHHTNIVPIFGVGESNGLNYYVMQYIDGVALNEAVQSLVDGARSVSDDDASRHGVARAHETARGCDRRNRAHWKRLAGYGVQVARAVDYAHCRGVLHRDIKPANLLVDCQGTVWITDFGLAKVFGDEELTRSGDFCGTVRYMAPEQFEGRSAPASDIYSIGITLYELATGGPAFGESDPKQLIHRITGHCLPQPRSVNRSIPRELETIILKAAAHDDHHRYATAGELADDLQRFIDGEPIAARRASLAGRLYRWGRRNPALAMLTGLSMSLLLLVAVVASVGYVRVDEARRQALDLAKSEMQSSRELRQASRKANDESERAKREYERAEDNLRLAMQAFEEIMESISSRGLPQLLDVELDEDAPPASPPLITGADAELLQRFLTFYVAFAERNNAGAAVQRETAKAYQRIGDIRQRLGQFEQAVAAYDASLAIYDRIAVQDPADPCLVVAATDVRNQRGTALLNQGKFADALAAHLDAKTTLLGLPDAAAQTTACRFALARTYSLLASVHPRVAMGPGRPGPSGPPGRPGLSGPPWRRGPNGPDSVRAVGRFPRVEDHYQAAIELLDKLVAEDPANIEYHLTLARCHRNYLPVARRENQMAETTKRLEQSMKTLEDLAAKYPDDPRLAFELADLLSLTAVPPYNLKRDSAAEHQLQRAVSMARKLNASAPHQPEFEVLLASSLHRLGLAVGSRRDLAAAQLHLLDAEACFGDLAERFPSVPVYIASASRISNDLGTLQRDAGQLEASRKTLEDAIRRLAPAPHDDSMAPYLRHPLVALRVNLAQTLRAMGRTDAADDILATQASLLRPPGTPAAGRPSRNDVRAFAASRMRAASRE